MTTKFLHNAKVITAAGQTYDNGSVLIEGSRIAAVGTSITPPADAEKYDLTGCVITPGLVDAHTHIGNHVDGYPIGVSDTNEMTDPVTPYLRILDAVYPEDPAFVEAMESGVTAVQTLPGSANIIGGQGMIIKTKPGPLDSMVVKQPSGMKAALGENPIRVYTAKNKAPVTRMGNGYLMRDAFVKAQNYRAKKQQAERKGDPFDIDLGMENLVEVLERRVTFRCHCHRNDDIQTAVRIAEEFGLDYTIEHCTEGHLIADWLAEHHVKAAVGPLITSKAKLELINRTWTTPAVLHKAGVKFCIITDHPVVPLAHINVNASLAVRGGLPYDEAIKAITIYGAEHIGVADRLGSLEVGKDADIAVWNGDPLNSQTNCVKTFINGELVAEKK